MPGLCVVTGWFWPWIISYYAHVFLEILMLLPNWYVIYPTLARVVVIVKSFYRSIL